MKKLLLSTTIISSLLGAAAQADYNADGTDYRNDLATQESWTEDLSNMFLELPNSFACIIANSGSSVNANADWQALISEVACGLEEPDDNVSATVYSSAAMSSSRASNDTPQEVSAWFSALSGDKYITNTILRASAETLAPYGSWYFSFIKAMDGDDEQNTELTAADTPEFGYVDISETDEGDVEIKTAQTFSGEDDNGSFEGTMRALIRFIDGSSDNTVFIGESDDSFTEAVSGQTFEQYKAVAGATSATHYFRVNLGGSEENPTIVDGSQVCYSRDDQFETAYDVKLYNPTTGDEVELMSGFDITTAEGSRGYFGRWGVWVDSDAVLFTPESNTNAATKEDGTAATLKWAPGKLELETYVEEALADGDTFDTWLDQIGSEAVLTWSAEDEAFSYTTRDGEQSGVVEPPEWGMWMWSMAKRTSVIWNGENTIEIRRVEDTLWTDEHTAAASTKFYSKWEWTDLSDPDMLPISNSEFAQNGNSNFWDNQSVGDGGTNGVRKTYHLTGAEPGAGFEPHTLYVDTGDGALSADDKPVRFDFGIDNSQSTYVSYADGSDGEYTQPENSWPHANVRLIKATDVGESGSCTLNATYECPTYSWSFGAMPWDQSVTAYDADDARIELDEELVFQLEYDSANDRNKDVTISLSTMDTRNPIPGCSIETGEGDDGEYQYYQCTNITVDVADGEKFFLNYDGQRLHGLPGTEVCDTPDCSSGSGYWMHLLNLADGTTITDLEGNEYVTLAGATSSQLIPADAASCGGIAFDSLDDIGLGDSSEYPQIDRSSDDYPMPQIAWGDQPTELSCTVTMGDTSDCVSE